MIQLLYKHIYYLYVFYCANTYITVYVYYFAYKYVLLGQMPVCVISTYFTLQTGTPSCVTLVKDLHTQDEVLTRMDMLEIVSFTGACILNIIALL